MSTAEYIDCGLCGARHEVAARLGAGPDALKIIACPLMAEFPNGTMLTPLHIDRMRTLAAQRNPDPHTWWRTLLEESQSPHPARANEDTKSRRLKFRVPTRCQNGHFRWYFYELAFGESRPSWSPTPCKCTTHEIGAGFGKVGNDQQFTGLLDKHLKEIFEGDVVKFWSNERIGVITWNKERAAFELAGGHVTAEDLDKSEIVGHIYEGDYRGGSCSRCGRQRVQKDGVCEKCLWDNDGNDFASITRPGEYDTTGQVFHRSDKNLILPAKPKE